MAFLRILALFAISSLGHAGNFELSANVSKDHVELGESFTLSMVLAVDGNLAFAPQVEIPKMENFQVLGGPNQSQQVSWVNGVVKQNLILQWDLAALKSGKQSLGPFKASAKDASQGEIVRTAAAIPMTVAKGAAFVIPPTPTPEPDGSLNPQSQGPDQLRDIKGDLGFPWARAALVALPILILISLGLWWWLQPAKVKPVQAVRDAGQVALMDLEKARELLLKDEEGAYAKELARILRYYLKHRLRTPEKEMTLSEGGRLMGQALRASGADEGSASVASRLEELLFAGSAMSAADRDQLAPQLRQGILDLEKGARWAESDLLKAELDKAQSEFVERYPELYFRRMSSIFKAFLSRAEERIGAEALQEKLGKAMEALGPAATSRVGYIILSRRQREELDLEKLNKDLQRLAELLDKGATNGK